MVTSRLCAFSHGTAPIRVPATARQYPTCIFTFFHSCTQVLDEQRRLRASMSSVDDGMRRMRSLVTHKKLKEIALAQADEVSARCVGISP